MSPPLYQNLIETSEAWLGRIPRSWKSFFGKRIFVQMRIPSQEGDVQLTASQKYGVIPQALFMKLEDQKVALAIKGTDSFKHVAKGDFIISLRSFQGGIEVCHYEGCVSPAYVAFRMRLDGAGAYFSYLFKSQPFIERLQSLTDGMRDGKMISFEEFGGILLPFPDKLEQRQIAAYLNRETAKIDRLIAKQKRLIELLQEKRQAVISRAVTKGLDPNVRMKDSGVEWLGDVPEHWKVCQLKWITSVKRGASPRPIDDIRYFDEDGEYAWVRIADVTSAGMYLEQTTQRLSELGSQLSVRLNPGSLFMSIAGTVGKPCIAQIKCCIHDGFVHFSNVSDYSKWLYYIFDTKLPFGGLGKMGTQLNLNTDTVGSVYYPFPTVAEIKAIIEELEIQLAGLDTLRQHALESVALLNEHRQALISAAVTGKIDVRGLVTDEEVAALDTESAEVPELETEDASYITEEEQG